MLRGYVYVYSYVGFLWAAEEQKMMVGRATALTIQTRTRAMFWGSSSMRDQDHKDSRRASPVLVVVVVANRPFSPSPFLGMCLWNYQQAQAKTTEMVVVERIIMPSNLQLILMLMLMLMLILIEIGLSGDMVMRMKIMEKRQVGARLQRLFSVRQLPQHHRLACCKSPVGSPHLKPVVSVSQVDLCLICCFVCHIVGCVGLCFFMGCWCSKWRTLSLSLSLLCHLVSCIESLLLLFWQLLKFKVCFLFYQEMMLGK